VIVNTGAQKGFLILKSNDILSVEAEGTAGQGNAIVLNSIPVDKAENLSAAIVNYVSRTHKTVILDDPIFEGPFKKDPYILTMHPKSILCEPLLYKSELIGILYLENNRTKYAFTNQGLTTIRLLSSEMAV
jgi:GAF domain-containing protein